VTGLAVALGLAASGTALEKVAAVMLASAVALVAKKAVVM